MAALLTKNPTASVMLRSTTGKATVPDARIRAVTVQDATREHIADVVVASSARFEIAGPTAGSPATVDLIVRHP